MNFGKIDYLNLLPFHVFLKQSPLKSYVKMSIEHKKGIPSKLNHALLRGKIDAAIISSVESRHKKYKKLDLGIVAKKDVKSVLVRKNSTPKTDKASASSNMLAKILNLKGEVIIGDNALKAYINEGEDKFYDLAKEWHKKHNLPFVFARFCYTKNGDFYKKIAKIFIKKRIKIPIYILQNYAKTRQISAQNIKWYLNYISYKIGKKEKIALLKFLKKSREFNFNPNFK